LCGQQFGRQGTQYAAVDARVPGQFGRQGIPQATEPHAVGLHHRRQRHPIAGALYTQRGGRRGIESGASGNRGTDRSNVGRAAGDDHIESQWNSRSVKLHFAPNRAREHHRNLVGALTDRVRHFRDLLLHAVAIHGSAQ
jgi:hypothetical protein